jgi:hypothetical protein
LCITTYNFLCMIYSKVLHCVFPLYLLLIFKLTLSIVDLHISVTFSERPPHVSTVTLSVTFLTAPVTEHASFKVRVQFRITANIQQSCHASKHSTCISNVCRTFRCFVACTFIHMHAYVQTHTHTHTHMYNGAPYLRVIRCKTYRGYVKPRKCRTLLYNMIFVSNT